MESLFFVYVDINLWCDLQSVMYPTKLILEIAFTYAFKLEEKVWLYDLFVKNNKKWCWEIENFNTFVLVKSEIAETWFFFFF